MPKYAIYLTRDCTFTQTSRVEIEADDVDQARDIALGKPQGDLIWEDDPGSFHFGEDGAYIADPEHFDIISFRVPRGFTAPVEGITRNKARGKND